MAIWRGFIDDSASEGRLMNYDGTSRPVQKMDGTEEVDGAVAPVLTTGGVLVRGSQIESVKREVIAFRYSLMRKYKLGSDIPPVLHMRHLWGDPARFDKGRNPFFSLSKQERFYIARDSYSLLSNLSERYDLRVFAVGVDTAIVQVGWEKFFTSPDMVSERQLLYKKFRGAAKKFYNHVFNPLIGSIAGIIHSIENFAVQHNHSIIIGYDSSESSKGFDSDEFYDVMHEMEWMSKIIHSSHSADTDLCLLQLADLVSFWHFRVGLDVSRGNSGLVDKGMTGAVKNFKPRFLEMIDQKSLDPLSIATHYIIGRALLANKDADWVEEHTLNPQELRAAVGTPLAQAQGGIGIIRPSSLKSFQETGRVP